MWERICIYKMKIFCNVLGGQKLKEDPVVCEIYFNNREHCGGGIMALDGKTG